MEGIADRRARILVVDDLPLVAEGVRRVLDDEPDLEVVGVAETAESGVELVRERHPDVVLVDCGLPQRRGAEVAAGLRAENGEPAIVFLSVDDSDEALISAVEAGATAYLPRASRPEAVVEAVRRAARGEMQISATVLARLLATRRALDREEAERERMRSAFTPREQEILGRMSEGLDNPGIARHLGIEVTTVRWHVRNILEKLGVHSKLGAVLRAAEYGLPLR